MAVHPIADGDDGIEVVKLNFARDFTTAFGANYFHFGNSCPRRQFPGVEDVLQVLVDGRYLHAKQLRQRFLRQPHRFVLHDDFNFHRPIWRGVEEKLVFFAHGHYSLGVLFRVILANWPALFAVSEYEHIY